MNRWVGVCLLCLSLAACGAPAGSPDSVALVEEAGEVAVWSNDAVLFVEISGGEVSADTGVDFGRGSEVDSGEPLLECAPGEGCFLDKCNNNSDCQSGWCVNHMGEGVCTKVCNEDCPPGWDCKMIAGTALDVVYVCVSHFANLCRPCNTTSECEGPAGSEDVCVAYGTEGAFCGGQCGVGSDGEELQCPWGFSCEEVTTIEGVASTQCVAEAGSCPCTEDSVTLSLWTSCASESEFGTCEGKRVCTEEGLTDCDALTAQQEVCNGLDDDCDGELDEPELFEGEYGNICDDTNDCTEDSCKGEDGCQYEPLDSGECLDGDPCTAGDHCEAGQCVGNPIVCDDDDPCTDDACDGLGGCLFENNESACDDGDPCTVADQCSDGSCLGVSVSCDCQVDEDCLPLEDEDVCNGVLECNTSKLPYRCGIVPGSLVVCPEPEGVDAICLKTTCSPESGECGFEFDHEGFACEDGDLCTVGDSCAEGVCVSGVATNCNDGNPCTDDSCDPTGGCLHVDNTEPCNDGDTCTTGDACAGGVCVGEGALVCEDDDVCTSDSCDPATGCVFTPQEGACEDGNLCTIGETCVEGQCVPTGSLNCDDDSVCTTDTCQPDVGCVHALNEAPCDDGDLCTTGDHCHLGGCIAADTLICDDGNACTNDGCTTEGGCAFVPNQEACSDGNLCTTGDQCSGGWCAATGALDCDDGNPCTDDSCNPQLGCANVNNAADCDDGDVCSTGDKCTGGACVPDGELECDDSNLCTTDSCDVALGCIFQAGAVECDDENICTIDLCDPATGECAFADAPDGTSCDDGKDCTEPDQCLAGVCSGAGPAVCPHNIYVDINSSKDVEDGTLCYPWKSIAMGLADAKPGDFVLVFPGNYEESLSMPSGVKLRSLAGAAQTFIKRNHGGGVTVFNMKGCSEETLIEGFTIEAGTGNGQSRCFQIWDGSSPTIRNNVCVAHHWQAYAITISGKESRPKIINNTIKGWDGNADTVSIVVSSGYPTVKNNIFMGDATSGNKNSLGIDANNGYFPELNDYNYYHKMTKATDGCATGEGAIYDNGAPPIFVDEGNWDYQLADGSPGIDKGDPDPAYNDADGSRNDMGAFGGPHAVVNYDPPVPEEPCAEPLPPDTVYVDAANDTGVEDGTEDHPFDTIGEGMQYAGPGDYVRVAAGNYHEVVTMKPGINLLGADPANTSIDGEGLGDMGMGDNASMVVYVSENSLLAGFRVVNSGYYGVYCKGITGVEMRNMILAGIPHTGFRADNCGATLINNTFVNCGYAGITAGNMNNNVSVMNNIFANGGSIYEVPVDSSYSTYFNTGYYSGGGVGDINSDPQFQDAANGDYRLKPGSPAENTGNPAAEYNDEDGTQNDMGAFGGPKL